MVYIKAFIFKREANLAPNLHSGAALAHSPPGEEYIDHTGSSELRTSEKYLPNYHTSIVKKLSACVPDDAAVLEFGAGIGTLAELWRDIKHVQPDCLEIDAELRAVLNERQFRCYPNLEAVDKSFDAIYTSNALEHILEDIGMLRRLGALLKPGGRIAIYVPAHMCLYSELDMAIGRYRRYEKQELITKVGHAGFEVEHCCYADSLGFFAWLTTKLRAYQTGQANSNGLGLKIYDRYIFPLSRFLDECGLRHVFGKNLLLIAKKKSA